MEKGRQRVHIIAEIGTSHGGDASKARQLVRAAADAGADSVKFQWVYADEILHPDTGMVELPGGSTRLFDRFRQLELPPGFYGEMRDYARSCGCGFICSPFGPRSLDELAATGPDAIKIASPELNHFPLLRRLAEIRAGQRAEGKTPFPVMLSSGVSTLADIEKALGILGPDSVGITLLHCVTAYPAPPEQYNLKVMANLGNILGVPTGVSDHSTDPYLVPVAAAVLGATHIEKHITLSRKADGLDDPVALEPGDFKLMVARVRDAEDRAASRKDGAREVLGELEAEFGRDAVAGAVGNGVKRLAPAEEASYGRTNRSIHFMRGMRAGETIREDSVAVLRTERILTPGISPEHLDDAVGAVLSQDVAAGQGLEWAHLTRRGGTCD